jgi:hypothetical protein
VSLCRGVLTFANGRRKERTKKNQRSATVAKEKPVPTKRQPTKRQCRGGWIKEEGCEGTVAEMVCGEKERE